MEDFLRREGFKELVFLVYVFSMRVLSMAVLVDFIGLYQGTILACFGSYCFGYVWIRKDYIGISLVVFPCSFSRHISLLLPVIFLYYSGLVSCISAC